VAESCDLPKDTSETKSTSPNGDDGSESGIPACQGTEGLWLDLRLV